MPGDRGRPLDENSTGHDELHPRSASELAERVKQKLTGSILRRLLGRQSIERSADFLVYAVYSWGHEALLALGSMGIAPPLAKLINRESSPANGQDLTQYLSTYPRYVLIPAVVFILIWLAVRVFVGAHHLREQGPMILACRRELGLIESELESVLDKSDPIPGLLDIQTKSKEVVDRYYKQSSWPWPIGPQGAAVDDTIARWANDLCKRYRGSWKVV